MEGRLCRSAGVHLFPPLATASDFEALFGETKRCVQQRALDALSIIDRQVAAVLNVNMLPRVSQQFVAYS